MSYDANGNLTKDLDRDIVTIKYNLLNLPEIIQFKNGNQIRNLYDASGQKLSTRNVTIAYFITEPIIAEEDIYDLYEMAQDNEEIYIEGTEYIGNVEYSHFESYYMGGFYDQGVDFQRLYNAEGYCDNNLKLNYYRRDHLGNNREVWRAPYTTSQGATVAATTIQRTQYYPSGLPWASNSGDNPWMQNKKYNGKEFVEMHGLDEYDSMARWYYPAIVRTPTMDPHCESYYDTSPYAWCGNNPVNKIDIDGRDVTLRGDTTGFVQSMQNRVGTSVNVTLGDNGYLSYTVIDKENISPEAQILMTAIDNHDVQLDLYGMKGFTAPDGSDTDGGAFMGNTVIKDAKGKAIKVIAQQALNVDFMNKLDAASSDPKANGLMHEISEAYIGATNSLKSGNSAAKADINERNNPNSAYRKAHGAAYPQPDMLTYELSPNNYYTTRYAPIKITVAPASPIYDNYLNGKRIVKFFTR